jgi:hypothetical protein
MEEVNWGQCAISHCGKCSASLGGPPARRRDFRRKWGVDATRLIRRSCHGGRSDVAACGGHGTEKHNAGRFSSSRNTLKHGQHNEDNIKWGGVDQMVAWPSEDRTSIRQ